MKSLIGDLSTHASVIGYFHVSDVFDTLDQPFDEDASPIHVTGSAVVTGGRGVVLHLHKRLGIWLQPGGHIDRARHRGRRRSEHARELPACRSLSQLSRPLRLICLNSHLNSYMSTCIPGHAAIPISIFAITSRRRRLIPLHPKARAPTSTGSRGRDRGGRAGAGGNLAGAAAGPADDPTGGSGRRPSCARVYRRSKDFAMPEVPEPHTEADVATWMAEVADSHDGRLGCRCRRVVVGQIMLAPGWCTTSTSTRRGWVVASAISSWRSPGNGSPLVCSCGRSRGTRGAPVLRAPWLRAVEITDGAGNEERWPDVRYVG